MATNHNIGPHTTAEQALDIMYDLINTNIQMTGVQHDAVKEHLYNRIKTDLTLATLTKKKAEADAS